MNMSVGNRVRNRIQEQRRRLRTQEIQEMMEERRLMAVVTLIVEEMVGLREEVLDAVA